MKTTNMRKAIKVTLTAAAIVAGIGGIFGTTAEAEWYPGQPVFIPRCTRVQECVGYWPYQQCYWTESCR